MPEQLRKHRAGVGVVFNEQDAQVIGRRRGRCFGRRLGRLSHLEVHLERCPSAAPFARNGQCASLRLREPFCNE